LAVIFITRLFSTSVFRVPKVHLFIHLDVNKMIAVRNECWRHHKLLTPTVTSSDMTT